MRRSRLDADRARADARDWAVERRARTRHLIELGGLVAKAGLPELAGDDRATMLGALLDAAARLRGAGGDDPAHLRALWRRAGLRAFDADREEARAAAAPAARTAPRAGGQEEEGSRA